MVVPLPSPKVVSEGKTLGFKDTVLINTPQFLMLASMKVFESEDIMPRRISQHDGLLC